MIAGPDATTLTAEQVAGLERLTERIRGIPGWLAPREAWELHEAVLHAAPGGDPVVVEIGSWKGRSTVALGLALKDRGVGTLHTIDPHVDADHRYREVLSHLRDAGLEPYTNVIRAMSFDARSEVPDRSVDVLFIDGAHDYASVTRDVQDWVGSLRPGAVVAFNDPMWPGVNRVLRERVAVKGPFRRPKLVVNSVFVEYRPHDAWSPQDSRCAASFGRLLRWGMWFTRLRKPVERLTPWPVRRAFGRRGAAAMYRLHPDVDLFHYSWLDEDAGRTARDE